MFTLSNAFDLGPTVTDEIYKNASTEEKAEAQLDYAISFLENLSKISRRMRFFFF